MWPFSKKKKDNEELSIVEQSNNIQPTENTDNEESSIIIQPATELDLANKDHFIKIKDGAAKLSPLIGELPNQANNIQNYKTLSQNLYKVTFNGQNVRPEQLYQKKNGNYISNFKSGKSWGKQTDLQVVDTTDTQLANVANTAFGLASVATSTYYLKNIDDKLNDISATTNDIKDLIEIDKQKSLENDFEILHEIINNIDSIRNNIDLRQINNTKLANIQRDASKNIKEYETLLYKLNERYIADAKKKTVNPKLVEEFKKDYFYYQLSLETYSLSKLVELQVIESFDDNYLKSIKYEFKHNSDQQMLVHDHILDGIFSSEKEKFSSKVGLFTAATTAALAESKQATELGLNQALKETSNKIKQNVNNKSLKNAFNILDEKSFTISDGQTAKSKKPNDVMKPYVDLVTSMESTFNNPMTLISDGKDLYLEINTDSEEKK